MNEPVFSLNMFGQTHHVVTSPSMAKALLGEKSTTSEPILDRTMEKVFGTGKILRKFNRSVLYTAPTAFITQEPHVATLTTRMVRQIRQTVPNLVSFSPSPVDQFPWERKSKIEVNNESNPPHCDVDLFALVSHYIGHLTTTALMGQAFTEAFPDFIHDLRVFDGRVSAMEVGITRFLPVPGIIPAYSARKRLIQCLATFHAAFAVSEAGNDPGFEWSDLDDVSEFMQARSRALITNSISPESAASESLYILWAVNVKITTIVYWHLSHILADDNLHAEIAREIAPYARASRPDMRASGFSIPEPPELSLDLDGLLRSCPVFKSTFLETLRLHTSSITYRKLTEKITLAESEEDASLAGRDSHSYHFHTGEYIAAPQYLLNTDPLHFEDPKEFKPCRYVEEPSEEKDPSSISATERETLSKKQLNLPELEGILPFAVRDPDGEGEEFATRAAIAFTAAMLAMWDIRPADSGPWELPEQKMGSLVLGPTTDARARLRLRV